MILIKNEPQENGAYQNQTINTMLDIPEGWSVIPEHLEKAARQYLPFITLSLDGGKITGISDNPDRPEREEAPEQPAELQPEHIAFVKGLIEGYAGASSSDEREIGLELGKTMKLAEGQRGQSTEL